MARGDQILRQWNLLRALQTRGEGLPLAELAREAEVSERTIQRDIEVLVGLGFPIEFETDEFGKRYWRMPHDYFRSGPLMLSLTEAISLHLAEHLLDPLAGTYLAEGLHTILEKIRALVPRRALDHFAALDEILYVRRTGVTDYAACAETIRTLIDAVRLHQTVEVRYRALWRGAEYDTAFDPYGLVLYDGDLFLVGRSHRARAVRVFKVPRILAATMTTRKFRRPSGFRLEDQFRASFGIYQAHDPPIEIRVRFSGVAAALVEERVWHESQQLSWQPAEETLFELPSDRSDTLIATFRLAGVVEFKRWIKSFGDQAEVLRPAWLRAQLREELLAAAERYDS
ncbi:MAG: transcriptional regulator [Planctomycetota bacterium]|nr:MAG: transcriptional regulator [Planctomycetota bacterium]